MASYPPPPPPPPPGYSPPPSYGGYGGHGGYGPTRSTNGKAIAALVCGIAAFFVCFPPLGIAAVVLGVLAKREIAAEPNRYDGAGMALAGQILGWVSIAVMVIGVIFFAVVIIIGLSVDSTTTYESLAALAA